MGDRLADLCRAGVASLKIEGRMKSPLYVAAVTDYYRRLLDGDLTPDQQRQRGGRPPHHLQPSLDPVACGRNGPRGGYVDAKPPAIAVR